MADSKKIDYSECPKYDVNIGSKNLADFIYGIKDAVIDTGLGQTKTMTIDGTQKTLMNTGFLMEVGAKPLYVRKAISSYGKGIKYKLNEYWGMNINQILNKQLNNLEYTDEEKAEIRSILKSINSVNYCVGIIKLNDSITVTDNTIVEEAQARSKNCKSDSIRWDLDAEHGEIVGRVISHNKDKTQNIMRLNFTDYGKKWIIQRVEKDLNSAESDHRVIDLMNCGLIKPVEVECKGSSLIFDGRFVYKCVDNVDYIVAYVSNGELVEVKDIDTKFKNDKCYKYIKQMYKLLSRHKKYIIPYRFSSTNLVSI
ncbi:MAG: hypothetical protein IJ593_05275 [Lachnospiraceae bacterium]|nr:hypothetical protein [Lachnospiraceae bacterium]